MQRVRLEQLEEHEVKNNLKMIRRLLVVLTMSILCPLVYSQETNPLIYHNLDFGYSIQYPSTWELEEDQENQSVTIFEQEENSDILKHIQISVARWEDGDLAEFIKSVNIEDLENLYSDFKIIHHTQEETTCIYELSYTLNDVKTNSIFYFIKEEDNIYIIMAMTDASNYESDKETFMNIIESIEIQ